MNIYRPRSFRYALLGIGVCAFSHPLAAQPSRLTPAAIGQIVDEVLQALLPSDQLVSRVPVAKRRVFFDAERTIEAFGHLGSPPVSLSDLHLRSTVNGGPKSLIEDCDRLGKKSCDRLGWSVYVWIEPVSVTDSQAVVRANVWWPDRGGVAFDEGVAPRGHATLVGFSTEVYLAHSQGGKWRFVREGRSVVGN